MNAYVEPSAVAEFQKTGTWPDGTQIVKETSATQVSKDCNEGTCICINSASLRFIHRDDMEAEGYGAYLDQVEDIQ